MNVIRATREYEAWLAEQTLIHDAELDYKHERMADADDPFPFFRGTYYRWAQHWQDQAVECHDAPTVLSVGDVHVANFGNWRDVEGRLVWGVSDFDEADRLPYTHDLARLAASAWCARRAARWDIKPARLCRAILRGYRQQLQAGPQPFVLEERHEALRELAMAADRQPRRFWKKLTAILQQPVTRPPAEARELLMRSLPAERVVPEFRFHGRVGMGSLGKSRFIALVEWRGGWLAREAKAVTAPATAWLAGGRRRATSLIATALRTAVRCPDPHFVPGSRWSVRRLAPRCSRIELASLGRVQDATRLLEAMGAEVANVHAGDGERVPELLADLEQRPKRWLEHAVRPLLRLLLDDWQTWVAKYRPTGRRSRDKD
ncbi:MAG: DUF2252 family protein [Pirellulales bacterium]